MAESNFRGPLTSMGSLEVQGGTSASVEQMDGPSLFFQGSGIADIRGVPFNKDGLLSARVPMFMGQVSPITVDAIPQTFSSTALAASQSLGTTLATAVTLITTVGSNANPASQFLAVGVPIKPQGTSTIVNTIAIDFGFGSGTTTANSTTVNTGDNTKYELGQWLLIGNVGNGAATTSMFAQVMAIHSTNFTGITISAAAATTQNAPIGQADLFGALLLPPATQFQPAATPVVHMPGLDGGLARVHDGREMLARGVSISVTALASTSGTFAYLVTGYDVWRAPMTELISAVIATTNLTTIYGRKAFKYISSVRSSLQATTASVTVGISDIFGLPIRADQIQHLTVYAGNTAVANNVGFVAAVSTTGSPATNTTGDVRGTLQLSGIGPSTAISTVATTNGALRLVIVQDPPPWAMIYGTPLVTAPMFGNTQA